MISGDLVYLLLLTIAISVSYFPTRELQNRFFHHAKPAALGKKWIVSCLFILLFSIFTYAVSFTVSNQELGNRIIHAFGGGFLGYMVCFLAARDSGLGVNKFDFFVFSFMLVMTLGIFNEVAEFFLQNYFDFTAAPHINDTWLDLMSNITGAIIAAICFTPFLKNKQR